MTFAEKVYDAVRRIPKGRVATYGQIAEIIGCPGGARAVGNALHINPFAPVDEFSDGAAGPRARNSSRESANGVRNSSRECANGVQNSVREIVNGARKVVNCHRVVASDGSLAANFGCGGPDVQYARLLAEGVTFKPGAASVEGVQQGAASVEAVKQGAAWSEALPRVDLGKCGIVVEKHPLEPFLPANGRILFLGSFPPPKARWSMEFFYPNWINDFWRIQGLIHFGDAHWFEMGTAGAETAVSGGVASGAETAVSGGVAKRFDRERIVDFCNAKGLAFFDTASKVCRWKGNASDEFLEILEPANITAMLAQMPECQTIVTTGGKACEELASILANGGAVSPQSGTIPVPGVGEFIDLEFAGRKIRWWRMPSSSRAFPMSLKDKVLQYAKLFPQQTI